MPIKPIVTKEEMEQKSGPRVVPTPKGPRVRKLSEKEAITFKGLIFGPSGSGKTYTIVGLLLHGFKVCVISTDIGGDGLATVKMALQALGREDLLENCTSIVLGNYDEVSSFLVNPESIYPEIYSENFSWLFWDGLSGFQQNHLADYIGAMTPERAGDKTVSEARESGLQLEMLDWNLMKNGLIRNLDRFLKLRNRKTGEVYHKLVSCLEGIKSVRSGRGMDSTTSYQETKEPMLQGSGAKLIGPAFDLILQTRVVATKNEEDPRAYQYVCAGFDSVAGPKTRGLTLNPIEPGDFYALWQKISVQLGINKNNSQNPLVQAEASNVQ